MRVDSRRWGIVMAAALICAATVTVMTVGATNAPAATPASPCSAAYSVGWQTPSNSPPDFGVTITVTNNAGYPITDWTVSVNYAAGQTVIAGTPFSANVSQAGTVVTATPAGSFNANLAAGASTSFGFNATYNGTSNPLPAITCTGPVEGSGSATLAGSLDPLGVNTAAWDSNFPDPAIASDLSSANVGLVRYPGGSWADQYLWQPNTVSGSVQPVNYAQFSSAVDSIAQGQKFVTVDYGSDTPQSAAAWVTQAKSTQGQNAALWEIGNEEYGSWEADSHAGPHTASSYATNALQYMQAMKAADPKAQICYDYGMDGDLAPGSGVTDFQDWNDTILQADAADIDCADVHWYPINGTPAESVQSIMELVDNVPAAAREIHTALSTYDPNAYFVVGETNMSQTANEWNEEPVGALFAAANTMEWLSFGAQSVDWWDVHNYGSPTADFGMFSSGSSGEPAVDTPYAPYFGYQLAAKLAVKGAKVGTLPLSIPNTYSYYSDLPDGSYDVLLANADPTNALTLSTAGLGISAASGTTYTYSAANPSIVSGSFTGGSVTIPAESVIVLTSGSGTPPTTTIPPTTTTAPPTTTTAPPTTTTSTAPPTTAPPTTTTAPSTSGCSATWSVTNSWQGGFQLGFTVKNTGPAATSNWRVTYSWPGSQTISQIWSAASTQTGSAVSATSLSYDGALSPGGSTTFGLLGNGTTPSALTDVQCSSQ